MTRAVWLSLRACFRILARPISPFLSSKGCTSGRGGDEDGRGRKGKGERLGGKIQKTFSLGLIPRSSRAQVKPDQTYHTKCPLLAKITYNKICHAGP